MSHLDGQGAYPQSGLAFASPVPPASASPAALQFHTPEDYPAKADPASNPHHKQEAVGVVDAAKDVLEALDAPDKWFDWKQIKCVLTSGGGFMADAYGNAHYILGCSFLYSFVINVSRSFHYQPSHQIDWKMLLSQRGILLLGLVSGESRIF